MQLSLVEKEYFLYDVSQSGCLSAMPLGVTADHSIREPAILAVWSMRITSLF